MSCDTTSEKIVAAVRKTGLPALASRSAYNATFIRRELSPLGKGVLGAAAAGMALGLGYAVKSGAVARAGERVKETASSLAQKTEGVSEQMGEAQYAAVEKVARASNVVAGVVRLTDRLGAGRLGLALSALKNPAVGAATRKINRIIGLSKVATGAVGAQAGALSRKSLAGSVVQERRALIFFKKKVAVDAWNSNLSRLINRADHIGPASTIRSSTGLLVTGKDGVAWHSGALVAGTPQGERTLTHVQSLAYPGQHYYFDRPLSMKETVSLVTRQDGPSPQRMAGYIGEVSELESLCPGWAGAKHQLLKNRIYFPPEKTGPSLPALPHLPGLPQLTQAQAELGRMKKDMARAFKAATKEL